MANFAPRMVIGAFAVTYIPCCICTSVETQLGSGTIPVEVFRFFTVVVFLNSASNAVIYSIRSAEYRREIKRFIKDVTSKICPSIAESQRNTHVRPAFEMINFPSATSRTQANDVIPSGDHHSLVTLNVNRLERRFRMTVKNQCTRHDKAPSRQGTVTTRHRHDKAPSRQGTVTTRHRHDKAPSRQGTVTTRYRHDKIPSRQGTVTTRHRHDKIPSRQGTVTTRHRHDKAPSRQGTVTTRHRHDKALSR
ncbi:hypothetical protein QZH41_006295 [Actinostola sp. cb2023]|nr:hypothetical protein QZH41_006295 [Actinostola sp. cb2023]